MTKKAILYADGGSRGNPGPSGAGAVIESDGVIVKRLARYIDHATNNIAEYTSLIMGLTKAKELGFDDIEIRMDSELVVKQLLGEYKVKNEGLLPLYADATQLTRAFKNIKISHIARNRNQEADSLANLAMDTKSDSEN